MLVSVSQGGRANESGLNLESAVEDYLSSLNIVVENYPGTDLLAGVSFFNNPNKIVGQLLKSAPYLKHVGKRGTGEFLLKTIGKKDVRIECRNQDVTGSADEKLSTLYENAVAMEERVVLLVVEGNGHCPYALRQLEERCNATHWKIIKKVNLEEFKVWIKNYLECSSLRWPDDYIDLF